MSMWEDKLNLDHDTPNWKGMLEDARDTISKALADYPNFEGVYFQDGYGGTILMFGKISMFDEFPYMGYFPIRANLSDLSNVVEYFIASWKRLDNPDTIKQVEDYIDKK